MSLITNVRTACRGAIENGVTRCRREVDGYGLCSYHQHKPLAAKPGLVLLKIRLNRKKVDWLLIEGVEIKRRDENALQRRHVTEAEQHRRSATVYRSTPDSGVPVFGKDGAQHVKIDAIWNQLVEDGYEAVGCHIYQQEKDVDSGMGNLVVEFKIGNKVSVPDAVAEMFDGSTYGFVHVWVNPPKPEVGPTHTVNISHREEGAPAVGSLVWDNGFWALESI